MRFSFLFLCIGLAACSSRKAPLKTEGAHEQVSNHPKDRALAHFKKLVEQHRNKELSRQVTLLSSRGFKASNEYAAIFLGGQCTKGLCNYTYQISMDFYKVQDDRSDFQAISAIVSASQTKTPRLKQVLTAHQILKLID